MMSPKAGAAGVLAWVWLDVLGGLSTGWAVLVAVLVAAVVQVGTTAPKGTDQGWAPLPEPRGEASELQAASLAGRLLDAAQEPDRYRTRVRPRLRALALAKLRRAGIDELADPRAVTVLGAPLYALVTDPDAVLPDPRTAAALFAELEQP